MRSDREKLIDIQEAILKIEKVDLDLIWQIVERELPVLNSQIKLLLEEIQE